VTRFESESPKIVTRVESLTRVTLSLVNANGVQLKTLLENKKSFCAEMSIGLDPDYAEFC